jgi:hypothetical protein
MHPLKTSSRTVRLSAKLEGMLDILMANRHCVVGLLNRYLKFWHCFHCGKESIGRRIFERPQVRTLGAQAFVRRTCQLTMQLLEMIVLTLVIRFLELTDWVEVKLRLTREVVGAYLE